MAGLWQVCGQKIDVGFEFSIIILKCRVHAGLTFHRINLTFSIEAYLISKWMQFKLLKLQTMSGADGILLSFPIVQRNEGPRANGACGA